MINETCLAGTGVLGHENMGAVFEWRERIRRLVERWGLSLAFTFAGGLYNIDPFDQPGVEQGKQYAYGMMGRKGFEGKKKEVDEYLKQAYRLNGYTLI